MKLEMNALRCLLLSIGITVGTGGCAVPAGSGTRSPVPRPFADLLASDIRSTEFVTAYDAVYALRHEFLTVAEHHARGALVVDSTFVYVNGVRAGGIEALRTIPVSAVKSVRMTKPIDTTTALGGGLRSGAILVETIR